jgi:hypothetical protein
MERSLEKEVANSVFWINRKNIGQFQAVIEDAAVRLVGHQIDDPTHLVAVLFQKMSHFHQRGLRIDLPRGVVGGIEEHRLGPGGEGLFEGLQVQLKGGVGLHHPGHAAVIVGVKNIIGEKGCKDNDFIARVKQGLENDVQGPGGAAGEHYVPGAEVPVVHTAQVSGQGLPGAHKAGVEHVAVEAGAGVPDRLRQGLLETNRGLQIRVSQGKIKNLVRAQTGLEFGPLLKHPPDPGGPLHGGFDLLGNTHAVLLRGFSVFTVYPPPDSPHP